MRGESGTKVNSRRNVRVGPMRSDRRGGLPLIGVSINRDIEYLK